jgi:hypothetical protein
MLYKVSQKRRGDGLPSYVHHVVLEKMHLVTCATSSFVMSFLTQPMALLSFANISGSFPIPKTRRGSYPSHSSFAYKLKMCSTRHQADRELGKWMVDPSCNLNFYLNLFWGGVSTNYSFIFCTTKGHQTPFPL